MRVGDQRVQTKLEAISGIYNIIYQKIYLEYDDDDQDWGRLQGADETGGNISGLADAAAKPTVTLHKEEEDKTMILYFVFRIYVNKLDNNNNNTSDRMVQSHCLFDEEKNCLNI